MLRIKRSSFLSLVALLSCVYVASASAQSKTCDLRLEVIQNPAPGESKEIPVADAAASFTDPETKKLTRANLVNGMPTFVGLVSGIYPNLEVTKDQYKTTVKMIDLDCDLADGKGIVSEIIFLWKGDPKNTVTMLSDRSGREASSSAEPGKLSSSGPGEHGQRPKVISIVRAPYPAGASGSAHVKVEVRIDEKGNVISAEVLNEAGKLFRDAALKAAFRWKFKPALIDGKPAMATMTIEFGFGIGNR